MKPKNSFIKATGIVVILLGLLGGAGVARAKIHRVLVKIRPGASFAQVDRLLNATSKSGCGAWMGSSGQFVLARIETDRHRNILGATKKLLASTDAIESVAPWLVPLKTFTGPAIDAQLNLNKAAVGLTKYAKAHREELSNPADGTLAGAVHQAFSTLGVPWPLR